MVIELLGTVVSEEMFGLGSVSLRFLLGGDYGN
jgi:hypothetical protein